MADSSDSETSVVDQVRKAKRSGRRTQRQRQPTNMHVLTKNTVIGHVVTPTGRKKPTTAEVVDVIAVKKMAARTQDASNKDVADEVEDAFSGGANGAHDMGSFITRFSRSASEIAGRDSVYMRRVGHKQEQCATEEDHDANQVRASFELGLLIDMQMQQMGLSRSAILRTYGEEPADIVTKRMIEMVEEQDVWDSALRPDGTRVVDNSLVVCEVVPDYGTPSTLPYINDTLVPYDGAALTKPCARGASCLRNSTRIPGVPQFSRPEAPVPFTAWIPPDLYDRWRTEGEEPGEDWTCFPCHLAEVADAEVYYARKNITPPAPLNRHEVEADPTGMMGFPLEMLYHCGRNPVPNGVYGNFPRESMVQYAPASSERGKGSSGGSVGMTIVVPDFRYTSAVNGTD